MLEEDMRRERHLGPKVPSSRYCWEWTKETGHGQLLKPGASY